MQSHIIRSGWGEALEYTPQLFHRTDSFRFLSAGGRIGVSRVTGGEMVLARVRSTGHDITLEEPERLTLLFPWAGRLTCAVGDDMVGVDAGGVLAFGPNHRRTVVESPSRARIYQADVLTLPMAALQELLRAEDVTLGRIAPRRDPACAAMGRIRLRVGPMLNGADAGQAIDGQSVAFEELAADLAQAFADEGRPPPSAGRRRVVQAIALMHDRHVDPISIAGLATELGCSCRSLQAAFREAGHASPQDVLAGIRLDSARVRLLTGGQSVTQSALDSGFTHLGRFAQAYRRRFGERPCETLAPQRQDFRIAQVRWQGKSA